ncbi:MAG TPA: N-acetyl-alpha-D-glucosaminyl L-malate synthase BshA [Verrucomicrobiae bacterium]|nr:N-acetyl-alpha-D-glucosaminyl L-malate synthase BshA [Verrucomicrobiae bacterium]
MKIGIVCYPSYGGSGVVATELGKQLAKRGHEIHFITYERPFKLNKFYANIYFHEVEEIQYPVFKYTPYTLSLANKIVSVTRHFNLDLVHVHYAMPHSISAFLAKQMLQERNLPVVTTLHGTDITLVGAQEEFFDITRLGIEVSDGVTAVSQSLTRETREIFGSEREIETIYNFVDPEEFRRLDTQGLRKRFASPEEKIIVHISNFRPVKRICDVVAVFRRIQERIPARLLLIGDGPELGSVEKCTAQWDLEEKVIFLGKQESVVELLSIGDLFILPSEKESFGLVALEAMACEMPVIASDVGGIPEVVEDSVTGYLAPVGDVEAMAEKAIEILSNDSLQKQMAAAARRLALEKFHVDKVIPQYEKFYQKIIKK